MIFFFLFFQEINEEWISDKTRFACDGLKRQRLVTPMIKNSEGDLVNCQWEDALTYVAERIKCVSGDKMAGLVGPLVDAECMIALKDFLNKCGCETLCTENSFPMLGSGTDFRSNYIMNNTIAGKCVTDHI